MMAVDLDALIERLQKLGRDMDRHAHPDWDEHEDVFAAVNAITALRRAPVSAGDLDALRVLRRLELANDAVCGARPQAVYDAMIAAGMSDRLSDLDDARRAARDLLSLRTQQPAQAEGEGREPVACRVRVISDDMEEWSLLPAGGVADYSQRSGYECQPLYTSQHDPVKLISERDAALSAVVKLGDRLQRECLGLNNEGDPIGGDPPAGWKPRAEKAVAALAGCKIALEQAWASNREREAELAALRASSDPVTGWQGIALAPTDGTKFLGRRNGDDLSIRTVWFMPDEEYGGEYLTDEDDSEPFMTEWMPLPGLTARIRSALITAPGGEVG